MATDEIVHDIPVIPKLEPGDLLSSAEFQQRYQSMPDCKKAELVEGVVYMGSPVHFEGHGQPHFDLISWLGIYRAFTPGVCGADNASTRLDLENEPQPDCMLFIHPDRGGQVHLSKDDYVVGAPEFVAEISGSSVAYDRGPKLRTFCRHGVVEYFIWRIADKRIEWNALRDGRYELLVPNENNVLCSQVFPGLWLDVDAILNGDMARVLEVLKLGIDSDEHKVFVDVLQQRQTDDN